jgi:GNAT superfamily N-acetyltransferase
MNIHIEDVHVEFANKKDYSEVSRLLEDITGEIRSKDGWKQYSISVDAEKQKTIFLQNLDAGNKVFIAKYEGVIIGAVNMQVVFNLRHGWRRAHLEEVVVKYGYRQQGVGSKMIQEIVSYCKTQEIKSIKLLCGEQLPDSQKFYEANGFVCKDKGYRLELS